MPAPTPVKDIPDDKRTKLVYSKATAKNIEATKYYIFNETGNIMIASTVDTSKPLSDTVQKVFAEVAVFFAAMTRAITTTSNPNDGGKPYSLYNYNALLRVIGGSGLFVHVQEEDVLYTSTSGGADFSKELLQSLLGLATGAGEMAFATAMMASLGKEAVRISASESASESMVANIVFVCEYLLGMPIVSAVVVYADCKKHIDKIQAGPCFSVDIESMDWQLHKDTYLFVTPDFIRDNAGVLQEVESDPDYYKLVNWLQGLVIQKPRYSFLALAADDTHISENEPLKIGVDYYIAGEFLGDTKGKLTFASGTSTAQVVDWSPTQIKFTVTGPSTTPVAIQVKDANDRVLVTTRGVTIVDPNAAAAPAGN